jgi:dimethylhistidine N-methyltransferase
MSTRRSAALAADRLEPRPASFAEEVRAGLLARPKQLSARWFYDELGSSLFEAICRLPWYRITRAESALLGTHARAVADALGPDGCVIELGGGGGDKLAQVLEASRGLVQPPMVHLVDISGRALEMASRTVAALGFPVSTYHATYHEGLRRAVAAAPGTRRLVLFLGSNIGNFDPPEAAALVRDIADALAPGDLLLLGADLVKAEAELLLAYDDPLGVTAAFNLNVLQRINRELGAAFDLRAFAHAARWNAEHRRVEMHLVSRRAQVVRVPGARIDVRFDAGESIWTESSYKYRLADLTALGVPAALRIVFQWVEPEAAFALTLFERT